MSFQLLDDLSELADEQVSPHEMAINPFINSGEKALNELRVSHLRLTAITFRHRLTFVEKMLQDYFLANQENLLAKLNVVEKNIGGDITYLKNFLTSFV